MTNLNADSAPKMGQEEEIAFLLTRAGIVLTPEQLVSVADEWQGFRAHVELVNQSFDPSEEPALIFDVMR